MAARRPKRMSRKELRQQDEVMTRLQGLYEFLRKYRVHLIVGALALVVVLLVASALSSWIESSRREVAEAFDQAFAAVIGDVETGDEPTPAAPSEELGLRRDRFPTAAAKHAAAAERLEKFLAEHDDSALADDARLALASVAFDEGDYDDAAKRFDAWLDDGEEEIAPLVIEGRGVTAVEQQKYDEAAKWFGKLVELDGPYFKAIGHLHLGDLANPGVPAGAAKDAAKAKAAYEAGLAAITAGEGTVAASERWLEDRLERRIALLDAR